MERISPLLTDLYQLTMAQGYWKLGMHTQLALFDLFYRENPFQNGFVLAAGLESVIQFINEYSFETTELSYLETLKGVDNQPLFEADFLKALSSLRLSIDLEAVKEGTVVFPMEPLLRVKGPLWQCQLLETTLLNLINFPSLIATKAARLKEVAKQDRVVDFGLRRAQGPNGGLTASRAAFIGGVEATSNVLAGLEFNIPVRGTHAHSWIMAFDTELEAFLSYAKALPNNCVFLVDTYDTEKGVENAIKAAQSLTEKGYPFLGIRLDSGDLATLSFKARQALDKAGFKDAKIMASNELDEYAIQELKRLNAPIEIWGVGTRLVTGYDHPALGGVYKLIAIQDKTGKFINKAKRSTQKQTHGGAYQVRRFIREASPSYFSRDVFYGMDTNISEPSTTGESYYEDLLVPIFRAGKLVYELPSLVAIQERARDQIQKLPSEMRSLQPKQSYPVAYPKGE